MKSKSILLIAMCSLLTVSACKKDGENTSGPAIKPTIISLPTIKQTLAGKWFVVKDSIGVLNYNRPLSEMRNVFYNAGDFVVFNADNTGSISSQNAYNALYTNFPSQYGISINPGAPNQNFNYLVSTADSTLHIPMINSNVGIAYGITSLSAHHLVLHTVLIAEQIPHMYTFDQYIYLSK